MPTKALIHHFSRPYLQGHTMPNELIIAMIVLSMITVLLESISRITRNAVQINNGRLIKPYLLTLNNFWVLIRSFTLIPNLIRLLRNENTKPLSYQSYTIFPNGKILLTKPNEDNQITMSHFEPEYVKSLADVQKEPAGCNQLRQRNLRLAKVKGYEEMRKLEAENDKAWKLDSVQKAHQLSNETDGE